MTKRNCWRSASLALFLCVAGKIAAPAQTFTTIFSFADTNGASPTGTLVQGLDGDLYGTTFSGGPNYGGTVFMMTPTGSLTTVFNFCQVKRCEDGANPVAGLTLGVDGRLYGTSLGGGTHSEGTVFRISSEDRRVTLHEFCSQNNCADGAGPGVSPVQGRAGNWYGTTLYRGAYNNGTVYRMAANGDLTTIYNFCPQGGTCPDGSAPSGLIVGNDGMLYGTTESGGANDHGTVFKITPNGKLTILYSFCHGEYCPDGATPAAPLVLASDGNFYGTTVQGGSRDCSSCGTVFKITPTGTLTTLHRFCSERSCEGGGAPLGGLVQATDGNFYGTTAQGGVRFNGTVFKITPSGKLTTLHTFCPRGNCTDGAEPEAGLVQATDGNLYGTTAKGGGAINAGTVFKLSTGFGPFVEALPYADAAGRTVRILSQGLTGTTAVSFNGVAASFAVQSDTYLTAVVPAGATTGPLQVTTPNGVLTSNKSFLVLP